VKKRTTIVDIARLAKVSPAAVSLALNSRPGISDRTRARILKIVERRKFVPNENARRLLLRYSGNIGVLHDEGRSPLKQLFLLNIVSASLATCEREGYNLLFTALRGRGAGELPEIIRRRDVDGILLIGESDPPFVRAVREAGLPIVLVDEHQRTPDVVAVEADYRAGAAAAVAYLVSSGHRRIGYIGESSDGAYGRQTLEGFQQGLKLSGLRASASHVRTEAFGASDATGHACMIRLLGLKSRPTAVVCAADIYAVGALRAAREGGLRVPEDVSVIGMDDIVLGQYVTPPLTTVGFPAEQMGVAAVQTLLSLVRGRYEGPAKLVFSGSIVERASVAPPR
jgi:LacI family transcriptional regulator